MSLRLTNSASVQTPPTTINEGFTSGSFSMWLVVNSAPTTTRAGMSLFTQDGGYLAGLGMVFGGGLNNVLVAGAGSYTGTTNYYYDQVTNPLQSNVIYHVVISITNKAGTVYLNGVPAGTFTVEGTQVGFWNHGDRAMAFGPANDPTCDITIDDIALWNGYGLTAGDVYNLFTHASAPADIQPSHLAWRLPMNGTVGAPAAVGDAALTDTTATKLNISTITGTAVYGPSLLYVAPAVISSAKVSPDGAGVLVEVADSGGNPVNLTAISIPSIDFSAGSGSGAAAEALVGIPAPNTPVNEVASIAVMGTSGTLTLGRSGYNTQTIAISATPANVIAEIQSALAYLYSIERFAPANFAVTSSTSGAVTTYQIAYTGDYVVGRPWGDLIVGGAGPSPSYTVTTPGVALAFRPD